MAKTGAFYFLFEKRNQKTFRAEGFRKCLESRSVLCFLLSVVYNVFTFAVFYRRNKVVLRRAVVNAIFFFVRLFNLFILWMYNKALNVWSLGKLVSFVFPRLRLGKHRDSRENKTNSYPRDQTLRVRSFGINPE